MSIKPLSKSSEAHNKRVCYARRVSIEACGRTPAAGPSDEQVVPKVESGPDMNAALQHRAEADAKKAALEVEMDALPGKINKKARAAKLKQILEIEKSPEYIDACLVISGRPAKFGNFAHGQ